MTKTRIITLGVAATAFLTVLGLGFNLPSMNKTAPEEVVYYQMEADEAAPAPAEPMEDPDSRLLEHRSPENPENPFPAFATPTAAPQIRSVPTEGQVAGAAPGFWSRLDPNIVFNTLWGTVQALILTWVAVKLKRSN